MLEVRGLTKIYKTKNGADVHALDGVSLQLPEKGMVFLLGKSGSGKSTLLNVCGGLDAPTSGEIIVKGRSSKDFTQSDFDSYRNTFIGFIFQEYNILNEFSVEDNVALALELQGKSKDKKAVEALLKEVDLDGYGKRKPNTLSGGQKQRIAIARALVKSPEIIMADEPTGALDSNTGKQVFETLKKLSKDKLVLVVSHDREFAEQYGDRIIELKDGKILSDVTKTQEQQKEISANINSIGDVLCIKKGTDLSEKDFDVIKAFLKKSDTDIVIANNEKDVKAFKKASRITDDGEKEVFKDTQEELLEKKQYTKEDSKFIRSKLPAKHAIRIGISSLKTKPIRLFFTILLCTVAFVLFGLLSTMSFYNSESTFKQTMLDTDHTLLRLEKKYRAKEIVFMKGKQEYDYDTVYDAFFSKTEIENLQSQYGTDTFGGVVVRTNYNIRSKVAPYWINEISTFAYLPEGNSLRNNIQGSYPTNKEEICISSYMADVIINCKIYDDKGNIIDVTKPEDLIGKKIVLGGGTFKITGILNSGTIPEKFDVLKSAEEENEQLLYELQTVLEDGLQFVAFTTLDRVQTAAKENPPYTGEKLSWFKRIVATMTKKDNQYAFPEWSNVIYENMEENQLKIAFFNGEKTTLADGEVVVTNAQFGEMIYRQYEDKVNAAHEADNQALAERLYKSMDLANQVWQGGYWKETSDGKGEMVKYSEAELIQKINQVVAATKRDGISLKLAVRLFNDETQSPYGDTREFTVVGVALKPGEQEQDKLILSDAVTTQLWDEQKVNVEYYSINETKYNNEKDAMYGYVFVPYDHSQEKTDLFWELYANENYAEDDSRIKPAGLFVQKLEMVDEMVKTLSQVFLYVGIAMAVFAALLLSNFISVSISQKKKEIGILRAVGARSLDVFKIFFSESFVITVICVIIAIFGSSTICGILNQTVAAELGASLFVFGIPSLAVLILIALVTTIVATFLPVWNAAKKKPVDSIRAL